MSVCQRLHKTQPHLTPISHHRVVDIIDESPGDVTGIKSTMLLVNGSFAYGYSQYESGVHRLVRTSPFDAKGARHTSFASVRITPHFEDDAQGPDIELNSSDLQITTMRSQGAGMLEHYMHLRKLIELNSVHRWTACQQNRKRRTYCACPLWYRCYRKHVPLYNVTGQLSILLHTVSTRTQSASKP